MEWDLVRPEKVNSHRFPFSPIRAAVEPMSSSERKKVIINPVAVGRVPSQEGHVNARQFIANSFSALAG
jgi:hypothetical protein